MAEKMSTQQKIMAAIGLVIFLFALYTVITTLMH
jgi:hypothetical protein